MGLHVYGIPTLIPETNLILVFFHTQLFHIPGVFGLACAEMVATLEP